MQVEMVQFLSAVRQKKPLLWLLSPFYKNVSRYSGEKKMRVAKSEW